MVTLFLILLTGVFPALGAEAQEDGTFRVDLLDSPVYGKSGFSPDDLAWYAGSPGRITREAMEMAGWKQVKDAAEKSFYQGLGSLSPAGKKTFLSPYGRPAEEFSLLIPFTVSPRTLQGLRGDFRMMPALFLASLGDNWEIFLNGCLLRREMHLYQGAIISHRQQRSVAFPLDKRLLREGENTLFLRVVGDPSSRATGFFRAGPYYLGSYDENPWAFDAALTAALTAVYLFIGVYFLFSFLCRRKESYRFFFAAFSLLLGACSLARGTVVYAVIPDTTVLRKIELFSLYLLAPALIMFVETYCRGRIFLITKIYSALYAALAVSVLFFSYQFAQDTLLLWQAASVATTGIFLFCDAFLLFREAARAAAAGPRGLPRRGLFGETLPPPPAGYLVIGAAAALAACQLDIYDAAVWKKNLELSRPVLFVFTVAAALLMARRFSALCQFQERVILRARKAMNRPLADWIMAWDRDPEMMPAEKPRRAILFTGIRHFTTLTESLPPQELYQFLRLLNEEMMRPLFAYEGQGARAFTARFTGGGGMHVFADPAAALKTALAFRANLREFNKKIPRLVRNAPPHLRAEIGCGLAFGPVLLGIMGHSRRLDYTPLGDTVNLASRLEGLTRTYHTPVLFHEDFYASLRPEDFVTRRVDRIRVKDRTVDLYEEFSANNPRVRDLKLALIPKLRELQEMYFSGKDWPLAMRLAREMHNQYAALVLKYHLGSGSPADCLPALYYRRMRYLSARPGLLAQWDGAYTLPRT